jgi:hypothetical protein
MDTLALPLLALGGGRYNAESSKLTIWVIGLSYIDVQFMSSILRLQNHGVCFKCGRSPWDN